MHLWKLLCFLLCSFGGFSALAGSPYTTHAITADGQAVAAAPNTPRPWARDIIKEVRPRLPASERAKHHEGEGLFRVMLDADSGTVRGVVVMKSSGYSAIDKTIVDALRQWRLRPRTWKEFQIYVGLWLKPHRSNHALQPTAARRDAHVCFMKQLTVFATLAPASGG
jgi:TonB family protein